MNEPTKKAGFPGQEEAPANQKEKTPRTIVTEPKPTGKALKHLRHLPPTGGPPPPSLEAEPPHKALARANKRHAQLTEELRTLKADWAAENVKAQQCRQPIPTSEITFVETKRRELHLELERTQSEIGRLNKEIREHKAQRQAAPAPRVNGAVHKECPLKKHSQYPTYFLLAARDQLHPDLFAQVERVAKALLGEAMRMGCGGRTMTMTSSPPELSPLISDEEFYRQEFLERPVEVICPERGVNEPWMPSITRRLWIAGYSDQEIFDTLFERRLAKSSIARFLMARSNARLR